MSHEITTTDKMFSGQGIIPWHFNQTGKDGRATVEKGLLHPFDVVKKYLNWEVKTAPIYFDSVKNAPLNATEDDLIYDEIPGFKRIFRSDIPNVTMDITGKVFEPMQNEKLAEIIAALTGDCQNVETAGSLFGGKIVWFLLPLKDTCLPGNDKLKNYLMVSDGKCGNRTLEFRMVSTRVVCNNTFTIAQGENVASVTSKHSKTTETRLQSKFNALNWGNEMLDIVFEDFKKMQKAKIDKEKAEKFLEELFPVGKDGEVSTRTENTRAEVYSLFASGTGNKGKTVWDLFNGVTEYVDHKRPTRVTEGANEQDLRFNAVFFGTGNALKQKAFSSALALV